MNVQLEDINTKLSRVYTYDSQVIDVDDATKLPDAPSIVYIINGINIISVKYTTKINNELSGLEIIAYSTDESLYAIYPMGSMVGRLISRLEDIPNDNIVAQINGKVSVYQGTEKANQILKVATDGYVITEAGGTTADFASITGSPYDNTLLATALNSKASETDLEEHIEDTNNPHSVTKSQVGLSNVDNTSDVDKPISTATQTALDLKASTAQLTSHIDNKNNPHSVNKSQIGLSNVDNTSDASKTFTAAQTTSGVFDIARIPPAALERLVTVADDAARFALTTSEVQNGDSVYVIATTKLYIVTDDTKLSSEDGYLQYRAYVSWESIDNKPSSFTPSAHASTHDKNGSDAISIAGEQITAGTVGYNRLPVGSSANNVCAGDDIRFTNMSDHIANTSNPHSVTKEQVGLSNVDNTSDINKPVSTATQTALNGKQDTLTFDTAPTDGSTNPVTSGGVYTAINNKVRSGTTAPSGTATVGDIYVQYTGA